LKKADVQTGPLTMPDKNPAADCWGGFGAGHENGKHARHEAETEDVRETDRRSAQEVDRKHAPAKSPDN
jgi:hypothetical protein